MALLHLGSFESTQIFGFGTDILATTNHLARWRDDLTMLLEASIRDLRYSAPWHRIEVRPGAFDFTWMDGPMEFMRAKGMRPIIDPLHHTSFPAWLIDGFANPQFPELYARFIGEFAQRYEWVESYTIFNEPLPTTLHCSYMGTWYPHRASEGDFARMSVQVARAICLASETLLRIRPDAQSVHIDTCERHVALDLKSEDWVRFVMDRRFLPHDLLLGRVYRGHALWPYLLANGVAAEDLQWLSDHRSEFDVLGLDYYVHSEIDWFWDQRLGRANIARGPRRPLGFAATAAEYHERYRVPLLLAETNLRGTVEDRITWLRFMEEQCANLQARGVDLQGFCWYPSIDSTDWGNLCTRNSNKVDPQGIWSLDEERWTRHPTELSFLYAEVAKGRMSWADLPAYEFSKGRRRSMAGYRRLMRHWPAWQLSAV